MKKAWLWIFLFVLAGTELAWTQGTPPPPPAAASSRDVNAAFVNRRDDLVKQFEAEKQHLQTQLDGLNRELAALPPKIQAVEFSRNRSQTTLAALRLVRSFFLLSFLYIFFPILIINIFLYLYFKEHSFFRRYKTVIIIVTALILLFYVVPVLAHETPGAAPPLADNLDRLNKLLALKKSPVDEAMHYLQNASELIKVGIRDLELPAFPQWQAPLKPWARVQLTNPLELYYNLGVLYLAKGDDQQALASFYKMPNASPGSVNAAQQEALLQATKYLVSRRCSEGDLRPLVQFLVDVFAIRQKAAELIELGKYLAAQQQRGLALLALNRAFPLVSDYEVFLQVWTHFHPSDPEIARQAILFSLEKARHNQDVFRILEFSWSRQAAVAELQPKAVELLGRANQRVSDLLEVADFFLASPHPAEGQKFLQQAIANANQADTLIKISLWAMERRLYQAAHDAIQKIFAAVPWQSFNPPIPPPNIASLQPGGPYALVPEEIRLYVFFGILTQVLEGAKPNKAEGIYAQAVNKEVEEMVKRLGYNISGNLNHFFYLQKVWELLGQEKQLAKLLPVYEYLQDQYLHRLQQQQQQELTALQQEIERAAGQKAEMQKKFSELNQEAWRVQGRIMLIISQYLAIAAALLLILVGCGLKAWRHSQKVSRYPAFAAFYKFVECLGWVEVMAVYLFPLGIIQIVAAQFMQILQSTQQGVEAMCSQGGYPLPPAANPLVLAEPTPPAPTQVFCPHCGKPQSEAVAGGYCEYCGGALE